MKEKWEYFDGDFVADQYNDTLLKYSPWSGHRRFGYDLVSYYEPENLVELGSHYGGSAFAFAQAIKNNKLATTYYAIDLWEAIDSYTEHDYERDVYAFFKNIKEAEFADEKIKMMKMMFDEALKNFEDHSIEILHIDGSHDYEDVRHDFENWLPKMKKEGIILLHDISDQKVFNEVMGSCIFWKELKEKYPYTVEMQHSWGLGILFLSEEKYRDFLKKVNLDHYLKMCIYDENLAKDRIRTDYFKLMDADKWIISLKQDKEIVDQHNARLLNEIATIKKSYRETDNKKDAYVEELKDTIGQYEQTVKAKDNYAEELRETIKQYKHTVESKDAYAEELKETIRKYEHTVRTKDVYAEELKETIKKYELTVEDKNAYTEELKETIRKYERTAADKDAYAEELKETIKKYELTVEDKDAYVEELKETIRKYEHTAADKDVYADELKETIEKYQQMVEAKDAYSEELKRTIQGYEDTFAGKDRYIEELLKTIEAYKDENQKIKDAYEHTIQGKDAYIKELEATRKNRR